MKKEELKTYILPAPEPVSGGTWIKNSKLDEKYNILLTHAFTEAHIL